MERTLFMSKAGFKRHLLAAFCILLSFFITRSSVAYEKIVIKQANFEELNNNLTVSVGFREMFDAELRKRLQNGFTTSVVMRIFLYPKEGGVPLAASVRTLKVVYDLWDEKYLLTIEEPGRTYHRQFKEQQKIIERLTSFWRFPIVGLKKIEIGKQYFVAGIVEVNPMSTELLTEVRRWLRAPYRRHSQVGGESFFGSFVSIFVNDKIRRAEKTFKLRTQPFFRQP